jgi:ferrous-iron efflux pump FieF
MALVAGAASVVTVSILIGLKIFAYAENGSTSVLASLTDSVVDAAASLITLFSIRISLMPADAEHRSGHGKIEGLAALLQAAFIAGAAFFLLLESLSRFASPHPSTNNDLAIGVMGVSMILSMALVFIQNYSLRFAPSLAVEADKTHYAGDILVNAGVILTLWAIGIGAPVWIDPVFSMLISLYLVIMARGIAVQGLDMLLDRELPDAVRQNIKRIVLSHPNVMGMHDLRTHKSGMRVFISFDVELAPDLLLHAAHEILREVEHDLLKDFPHAEILIHPDPHGDTFDTRHKNFGML